MRLDVRGEICPYPMMRTVEALGKLAPGETLEVLTDHPPALSTIPWEAAKRGFAVEVEAIRPGEWRLILRPTGGRLDPAKAVQEVMRQLGGVS
ncbi:MAG: hypothetical protein C4315_09685 [Chloroflexota bacterium]